MSDAKLIQGFCPERLQRIKKWMDATLGTQLPGVALTIARNGVVVFDERAGFQDEAKEIPLAADTIYRLYSMSKPVAAVAMMILLEEGKYQLDEPISKYAPMFANVKVAVGGKYPNFETVPANPITFRHVLSSTAGFTYPMWDDQYEIYKKYIELKINFKAGEVEGCIPANDENLTLKDMCDLLVQIPLLWQPGEHFFYSVAWGVQGYLVEVLSGKPFDVFLKERLFGPLKMVDTDFWVPPEKINRFSAVYNKNPFAAPGTKAYTVSTADDALLKHPHRFSGGEGLVGTIGDYTRFAMMLANGGILDGVRILSPCTIDFMGQNQLKGCLSEEPKMDFFGPLKPLDPKVNMPGVGMGLGIGVVVDPARAPGITIKGELMWSGGANTHFLADRKHNVVAVFGSQVMLAGADFWFAFRNMVWQALVEP